MAYIRENSPPPPLEIKHMYRNQRRDYILSFNIIKRSVISAYQRGQKVWPYFSFTKGNKLASSRKSATLAIKCMASSAPDYLASKFTKRFNIMGQKLDIHNRYISPYLNCRVARDASIIEQWRYGSKRGYRGQRRHPPYTPYSTGNLSRVIFKTIDPKGD